MMTKMKMTMTMKIKPQMKALKNIALIAGAAALTACATATPYQPSNNANMRNGFSEIQIEKDRVMVTFDGNSLTERKTVETYLLYRAAELTKNAGFDHFILTERATDQKSRLQSTGFNNPHFGFFNYSYFHPRFGWSSPHSRPFFHPFYRSSWAHFGGRFGGFNDGWGRDFDFREITRYRASAEVKFGRGSKPPNMLNAFNAGDVMSNLGSTIIHPEIKEAKN